MPRVSANLIPARPKSVVREIRCVRGCGFIRPYTDAAWYLTRTVTHPLYGPVTGEELVKLDMYNHDCAAFIERSVRARRIAADRGQLHS